MENLWKLDSEQYSQFWTMSKSWSKAFKLDKKYAGASWPSCILFRPKVVYSIVYWITFTILVLSPMVAANFFASQYIRRKWRVIPPPTGIREDTLIQNSNGRPTKCSFLVLWDKNFSKSNCETPLWYNQDFAELNFRKCQNIKKFPFTGILSFTGGIYAFY